jgi:hypothetical protein
MTEAKRVSKCPICGKKPIRYSSYDTVNYIYDADEDGRKISQMEGQGSFSKLVRWEADCENNHSWRLRRNPITQEGKT